MMITNLQIPLSSMRFAQQQLQAAANNTANTSTDGFERVSVTATERQTGGVISSAQTIRLRPNERTLAHTLPGPQNNVDQVRESVNRISAQRSFEANSNVVRTQDRMTKSFLDITA